MAEKGLLSQLVTQKIAEIGDELIVLKGIAEQLDYFALYNGINILDNALGEKVPDPYRTTIRETIDEIVLEQDYDTANDKLSDLMVMAIEIPWLDDERTKRLFVALLDLIIAFLMFLLQKKTNAPIEP